MCDGRCGADQYDCEVPEDNTQCSEVCGTGAVKIAESAGIWTCECDWDYEFKIASNICEAKPNPCDMACEASQCTGPLSTDCTQCAISFY